MSVSVSCRGLVHIYRLEGYDVVALTGVDLDIAAGESVALLGPSGSGKSTLLHIFAGLLTPSAGRLTVGGNDMVTASAAEVQAIRGRDIGVVLQGTARNLLPYLSVEQNVRFAQQAAPDASARRGLPAPREVLDTVGLSARTRYRLRPAQLTPAERQRLALAVALANRPGLLLVDEPTAHLDSRARDEVTAALEAIGRTGTTVVVVTHDPEVGARFGRSVTIRDGRVGAEGRRGEDFSVVGRDGSVQLPPEIARRVPPGTLFRVQERPDGSIVLAPAKPASPGTDLVRSLPAAPPPRAIGVARPALPGRPAEPAVPAQPSHAPPAWPTEPPTVARPTAPAPMEWPVAPRAAEPAGASDLPGPESAWPDLAGPESAWPDLAGPGSGWPDVARPGSAWPDLTGPEFDEPGSGGPDPEDSGFAEPYADEQEITEPALSESDSEESGLGQTGPADRGSGEPGSARPSLDEPELADRGLGESGSGRPSLDEPELAAHEAGEPEPARSGFGEPAAAEPEPPEPEPAEPELMESEPALMESEPAESRLTRSAPTGAVRDVHEPEAAQ